MYSHTIYIPVTMTDIIEEVELNLSRVYGGCTSTIHVGKWLNDMHMITEESVMTINCITGYTHYPDIFMIAAEKMKAAGEEAVMMTRHEMKVNFE